MPDLAARPAVSSAFESRKASDPAFARFAAHNVAAHKVPGYGLITISLKPVGGIPGDASAAQMDEMAELASTYSQDELRVSHEQNIVLPHVALDDIPAVYDRLAAHGLATSNVGLVTDIICCPGLDYCALATARSIPIAQAISDRFADEERAAEVGQLKIKISGCINACGHHHVGHIGILGLEKAGSETYQLSLGGTADETCSIGGITGRGFSSEGIVDAVETVVDTYLKLRTSETEDFLTAFRRLGMAPFKEALYAPA
jgi:sulfite reductase (NADPH) hemoprotein beta-component